MALPTPAKPTRTQSYNVNCDTRGTPYTLYTCPSNCRSEMSMLMINNITGTVTLDATWEDASAPHSVHIVGGKNMGAGEYILFTGATLVLEPGDAIVITISGTGSCHVDGLCTVSETFRPIG